MNDRNFLLVGVGGQGTLLASNVVAEVGVSAGFDVKKAEVHGMAQRGGSVSSHTRWGSAVRSPLIARGEVDFLIAFEQLEALRYVSMLRPDGIALVGSMRIAPLSVSSGTDVYPDDDDVQEAIGGRTTHLHCVPSLQLAEEAGNIRAHNVVVLGALSSFIDDVSADIWIETIAQWVPKKYVEQNRRAFWSGRELGTTSKWEV
jgi:indolepyruvate ferredoxin oxidoreductase beta subunit